MVTSVYTCCVCVHAQALHDILARGTSVSMKRNNPSDDTDDEVCSSTRKDGELLVSCIQNISHFVAILPQIYPFLFQACLVETNLNYLQHYLLFLTQNYPHDKLYESVISLSRLIVDRFDVIKKIISPSSSKLNEQGSINTVLLSSLFELFHSAMDAALCAQTVPQISTSSDLLLVSFPSKSQKSLIHTALIQAIFLLLSLSPPLGAAIADFVYLRDLWVPAQPHESPEAHTMEGRDLVVLPPKEVLKYTLQSTNLAILEASIQIASPSLLSELVQCFGCPVACMERVLKVLDDTCGERDVVAELRHCVVNPVMMARYIEIQKLRGIDTGNTFLTFIRCLANLPPANVQITGEKEFPGKKYEIGMSDSLLSIRNPGAVSAGLLPQRQRKMAPQFLHDKLAEDIEQLLLKIFCQSSDLQKCQYTKKIRFQLESDLQLFLRYDHVTIDLSPLVTALFKVTSSEMVKVVEGMLQTRFAITLFRMMTQCVLERHLKHLSGLLRRTIHSICNFLESSMYKLTKMKFYHPFLAVLKVSDDKLENRNRNSFLKDEIKIFRDIKNCHNLSQMESAIVSKCHEAIQGRNLMLFESVVNLVVKKSLSLNTEGKCMILLHAIQTSVSSSCSPLAYQCNPKLFSWTDAIPDLELEVMEAEDTSSLNVNSGTPDITGSLVDVLEVLDSEIYNISSHVSMKFLFGYSDFRKGPLRDVCNLLLSGQGYLQACLVNSSSWASVLTAMANLLDRNNMEEW